MTVGIAGLELHAIGMAGQGRLAVEHEIVGGAEANRTDAGGETMPVRAISARRVGTASGSMPLGEAGKAQGHGAIAAMADAGIGEEP